MDTTTLDEIAYKSKFASWPPLGKLLLCLALVFGSLFATTPFVPLVVFLIGIFLLFASSGMKFPKYIVYAYLNTFVLLIIGVLIIAFITPGRTIFSLEILGFAFTLTAQGVNQAILVFIRAIAGFAVLLFFSSSTPLQHLFIALRQIKVPEHICELTVLVYRYFFLLFEQLGIMTTAADCRLGFRKTKFKFRTTGMIVAGVFKRSMDLAERAQQALYCRNFKGKFPTLHTPKKLTASWIFFAVTLFALLLYIGFLTKSWLILHI